MASSLVKCLLVSSLCPVLSTIALADTSMTVADTPVVVGMGGFIRADYGTGDRYSNLVGKDVLGISKAALAITPTTEDIKGVFVIGTTALTDGNINPDHNGQVGIKDAYIIVGYNKEVGFSFSAGAQPLLFGLKPNGYPGDSSLQGNIDYGAAGGFAVSNQAGPSLIGTYKFTPDMSIRFGMFDLAKSNGLNGFSTANNGSKITDNYFLLWRGNNLGGSGVYATAGAERTYVGASNGEVFDSSKGIYSVGVGYKQSIFDISVEGMFLDAAIANTQSKDTYIRVHGSVAPAPDWTIYADYSNGNKLGASTYRLGGNWQFRRHLGFTFEYSGDNYSSSNSLYAGGFVNGSGATFGQSGSKNVQSIDLRLTMTY